jgi:hypothetical protein
MIVFQLTPNEQRKLARIEAEMDAAHKAVEQANRNHLEFVCSMATKRKVDVSFEPLSSIFLGFGIYTADRSYMVLHDIISREEDHTKQKQR